MKTNFIRRKQMKKVILTSTLAILATGQILYNPVEAKNYVVKAEGTRYVPSVLRVDVGDTVSFENMAGHTTKTLNKYLPYPPGIAPDDYVDSIAWESKMGKDFTTQPFKVKGLYLVKCQPHWGLGMGMAIIVGKGNPTNLDDIEAMKPKGITKRLIKKVKKFIKHEK